MDDHTVTEQQLFTLLNALLHPSFRSCPESVTRRMGWQRTNRKCVRASDVIVERRRMEQDGYADCVIAIGP